MKTPSHEWAFRPRFRTNAFGWRGSELAIEEDGVDFLSEVGRWLDPKHRYFKVHGDDGGIYLIRQDTRTDQWALTLFDSGRREETRLSST